MLPELPRSLFEVQDLQRYTFPNQVPHMQSHSKKRIQGRSANTFIILTARQNASIK